MEDSLKFNSQICTTKIQSQRLLELGLKPETADMYIFDDEVYIGKPNIDDIPAWSLHMLIELYKDVNDTSLCSLENVNYNRLIQCISLAIEHGAFNKEYLKQFADLIEEIESQASIFACDKEIDDFELTVRITCKDGWCSANIINVNDNERIYRP